MAEQPIDPEAATALFRILRGHLSDDAEGRAILSRFAQAPEASGEELADYLRRRLDADDALVETLAASPELPADLRTVVYGGQVDRIIQIAQAGTVVVSPWARLGRRFWVGLAILTGVAAAGLIWAWLSLSQLSPMPSGFNIAVAQFATLDATGRLASEQVGRELGDWLFEAIKKETDQLPAPLRVNLRGPADVRIIPGQDRNTRAANAAQVAARHNATILIYGVVTATGTRYQVEPEFYVSGQSFGYGGEVAGPDRLGQPVAFTLPLEPGEQVEINEKLNARAQALQRLVAGLAYFYFGRYDDAWLKFQHAADIEGWRPEEGKEVVYLLMGAAKLRLYDRDSDPDQLPQALDAFARAYQLNSDYARSYLGLGAVAFQQAAISIYPQPAIHPGTEGVDQEKLIEAQGWYSASLSAADQPASAYVPVKAAFGLGQVHRLGYEYGLPGWSGDQARRFFDQVIAAYDAEPSPDLVWHAGHAHAERGRLAGLEGDWQEMSSEYRRAVAILSTLPGDPPSNWIARYWTQVAFALEKLNRLDAARDAYRQAIEEGAKVVGSGMGAVSPEELSKWQSELDRLENGVP